MARVVKLFILGLPGSGKSALSRYIMDYVNRKLVEAQGYQRWSAIRFNDYAILNDMFHRDTEHKRFKFAKPGGFDVVDLKVFDEALEELEWKVNTFIASSELDEQKLIIIEFSRNDYKKAFQLFNPSFLRDAHFLYLDTALDECKQRVYQRTAHPMSEEDDYPVSDYIFEGYYCMDDWMQMKDNLTKDYGVNEKSVWTFHNDYPYETACLEIKPYVERMIDDSIQEKSDKLEKPREELVLDKDIEDVKQECLVGKRTDQIINEKEYAEMEH